MTTTTTPPSSSSRTGAWRYSSLAILAVVLVTLLASAAGASAAPLNDHFADAIALTGSGPTASGDSTGASREAGEPPHLGWFAGGASIWWTWTATRTRSLVIDTCGSAFDAGLAVYTGASVDALTQLDQQGFGNCPGAPGRLINYVVTAGVTYHIAVDGYNGSTGAITLHLRPPPANDDFANAIVLSGVMATAIGPNDGASSEPSEPAHPENGRASVWYRWTAPGSGPVALSTCGSTSVKRVGIYTGATLAALAAVPSRTTICALQSVSTCDRDGRRP